jgi:hypothetical protein
MSSRAALDSALENEVSENLDAEARGIIKPISQTNQPLGNVFKECDAMLMCPNLHISLAISSRLNEAN